MRKPVPESLQEEGMPWNPGVLPTHVTFEGSINDKETLELISYYVQAAGDKVRVRLDDEIVFVVDPDDNLSSINRRHGSARRQVTDRRMSEDRRKEGDRRHLPDRRKQDLGHMPEPLPDPKTTSK